MAAKLENAAGINAKNSLIDEMLNANKNKLSTLQQGLQLYTDYANKALLEVPKKYREMAKNGSIDITEFAGNASQKTIEAIQNYRDWASKVDDVTQQIEEQKKVISDLAKQKFDNVTQEYNNQISLLDGSNNRLEKQINLQKELGNPVSPQYYESMIGNAQERLALLQKQKQEQQAILDEQVKLGNIEVGSDAWYEMVQSMYEIDDAILDCNTDIEKYKNSINEIKWDNFNEMINRIDSVNEELNGMVDLLSRKDLFDEQGEWTKEGISTLGLYAQQMENAQYKAQQYADAITDLNKDYEDGKYSETEYLEKLNELKSGQQDSINAYHNAQDAIKDLNAERIDAIKDGMENEIDAYSKLIQKKKEALNADKDLYDFEKQVNSQQKDIATIERKLAALAGDTSASAAAKRKQLEAELLEANNALEETYYERSVSNQQDALDKEAEFYEESKRKEMEDLDKYLEDTDKVLSDSVDLVKTNASVVYETLNGMASEYNLTLSDSVVAPWKEGENAISDYSTNFGEATSATLDQLDLIKDGWQGVIDKMDEAAKKAIENQKKEEKKYTDAKNPDPESGIPKEPKASTPNKSADPVKELVSTLSGAIKYGQKGKKVKVLQTALNALGFDVGTVDGIFGDNTIAAVRKFQSSKKYGGAIDADGIVEKKTKKKFKKAGYAKGTLGVKKNDLAIVDEDQLEELIIGVQGGRLTYLEKGSGVIPADLTANLMSWGKLDPSDMIERNRPSIQAPSNIHNTEIKIDASIGTLMHVDELNGDNPDEILKIVNQALEKHTKNLNSALKRYTR